MKFTVTERYYKTYEVEADSFEDALAQVHDYSHEGEFIYDELAIITDEDGREQIYS